MHHPTRALLALALCSGTAIADSSTAACPTPATPSVAKKATPKKPYKPAAPSTLEVSAGAYRDSRSLTVAAENVEGVTQYAGVPNNGLAFDAAGYPLRHQHGNGWLSSFGASFGVGHSVGADLTFDDGETVSAIGLSQSAWNVAAHHRLTAGRVTIDSELGGGQRHYAFPNANELFEVPDTTYTFLTAGAHVDVDVARGITLGTGAKYLKVLGNAGEMTDMEWYGPGQSSGATLDGAVAIPLPKGMFVRAKVAYTKLTTKLDGIGAITEDEGVSSTIDSTLSTSLTYGYRR